MIRGQCGTSRVRLQQGARPAGQPAPGASLVSLARGPDSADPWPAAKDRKIDYYQSFFFIEDVHYNREKGNNVKRGRKAT